jgi:hypothetical protein
MALNEQTVDVGLLPMNQQAPASAGPVGRVESVVNGVVRKFSQGNSGPRLRIEKRPGFSLLPNTTYYGGAATTAPSSPKMLASWNDRLTMVASNRLVARSPAKDAWEVPANAWGVPAVAPMQVRRRTVYSASSVAYASSCAAVGNVLCYVACDATLGAQCFILDADGTTIRVPFATTGAAAAKVVSDGTRFWVFSYGGTFTVQVQVVDTAGAVLASTTSAGAANSNWDVGYQSTTGKVVHVAPNTGGTTTIVNYYSYSSGISVTSYTPTTDIASGVAMLDNRRSSTNIYIAGLKPGGDVKCYEISALGAVTTTYATVSTGLIVGNVTGYVSNASFDLRIAISILADNTAGNTNALNNRVNTYALTHAGASSSVGSLRSVALVSRAWADDEGVYRVLVGYQSTAGSVGTTSDISPTAAQPTYFAMDLSATVPHVVGELEIGAAYTLYATSRNGAHYRPWFLASIATDDDGARHVALPSLGVQTVTTGGFTATTVLNDFRMRDSARMVQTADELLIGGLQGAAFDGMSQTEHNFHLAPDVVSISDTGAGLMKAGETYHYVYVWRAQTATGAVIRSAPSAVTTVGPLTNTSTTSTIASNRTTTHAYAVCEVYRTFDATGGTTEGTELRKVGEVANNVAADTLTFVDTMSDAVAADGEGCYAQVLEDNPALDHMPAPAFAQGCTAGLRAAVVGYDNAIWWSGERVEGEALWFNTSLRSVLPTDDEILSCVPMDGRLVVQCRRSLWALPYGNLPNANLTAGSLPTPEELPFTTGTTGPAFVLPMGAAYSAEGGLWLTDRGLSQRFIGAPVMDDIAPGSAAADMCVDIDQRLYVVLPNNPRMPVFDMISQAWTIFRPDNDPLVCCTWRGRLCYADSTSNVWTLDDPATSTFLDGGVSPYVFTVSLSSMGFGGASGWQRLWGEEIFGTWDGPHVLTAAFTFDNEGSASQALTMPVGANPDTYRYQFRQEKQKCIAVEIDFSDGGAWPDLGTIQDAGSVTMIVSDVSQLVVGQTYSTHLAGVLDTGTFTVTAINHAARSLAFTPHGGWLPVATHTITNETTSLVTGKSFKLESVELRIGVKPGVGRLPTERRAG